MDKNKNKLQNINPFKEAIYVALVYLVLSIIWIVFTDNLLLKLVEEDTLLFKKFQTFKGIIFVCICTVIIFSMVYHRVKLLLGLSNELHNHKKLTQAKITYMGLHDSLTGLPKRLLMEKRFLNLIEDSHKDKNIALVHLEIDNFTQITEALGNVAGDELMLHLSKILDKIINGDDLLAKLSQDAFGILLTDVNSKADIDNQVRKILEALEEPWIYEGRGFFTSTTAGIATYPNDCLEFHCLLRYSNIALKYAKLTNEQMYEYYTKGIETDIIRNSELVDDLKKALINSEFSLNYQLVLNILDKKVAGMETLIRWNHSEKGNIPPLDFIPIAERSNLIFEITDFVIDKALEQKIRWKDDGYNIPKIAINISPKSMNTVGFCSYIEAKLERFGINSNELILELTESTFIENLSEIDINIKYLRNIGVEIALDDFGTGYSTLARLKQLSIDYLKLDRAFIMDMTKDSSDESLVRSVIEIANTLGIIVCAEGIETLEVLNILIEMGCTLGQGYFIHKPSENLPLNFKYDICN